MGIASSEVASTGVGRRLGMALRQGTWLTPARLVVYPRIVGLVLVLAIVVLGATSHAGLDLWGRPLGTDFSGVWVAGKEVRAGHPAMPYDNAAHAAAQGMAFGPSGSFLPWPYPPVFLLLAGTLAMLPYLAALALWQGSTLCLYLFAIRRCLVGIRLPESDVLLVALAFPAVAINLLHGQNGFLSAGLVALGTLLLPRRPIAGGVLLGLLAYKPQLALAVPVALVAGRHWRALAAAAVTVAAMTAGPLLAYGPAPWRGFFQNLAFARRIILETGGLESFKLQSAFAAARLLDASIALAYAAQAFVAGLALAALALLWHRRSEPRLKLAGLAAASLLATPYCVDYDMVVLGPALAALVGVLLREGFPPFSKSLLASIWVVPLVARPVARLAHLPLGLAATAALLALTLMASRRAADASPPDLV